MHLGQSPSHGGFRHGHGVGQAAVLRAGLRAVRTHSQHDVSGIWRISVSPADSIPQVAAAHWFFSFILYSPETPTALSTPALLAPQVQRSIRQFVMLIIMACCSFGVALMVLSQFTPDQSRFTVDQFKRDGQQGKAGGPPWQPRRHQPRRPHTPKGLHPARRDWPALPGVVKQ